MNRIGLPVLCASLLLLASAGVLAGPVNINTADAETLAAELNGVGPVLAEAIVRDREQNGRYDSPEALMRVRGVGEAIIERNRPNILVSDAPAPSPGG